MILPFSFLTPSQKRRRVCPTDAVGVLVVGVLVGVRVYGDLPVNWLECCHRSSPGREESELLTVANLQLFSLVEEEDAIGKCT